MKNVQVEMLSPQQLQVLQLAWEGKGMKESAAILGLSDKTVKNYRGLIFNKLGVTNIVSACRCGLELGWLSLPVRSTPQRLEEWP